MLYAFIYALTSFEMRLFNGFNNSTKQVEDGQVVIAKDKDIFDTREQIYSGINIQTPIYILHTFEEIFLTLRKYRSYAVQTISRVTFVRRI